MWTFRLKNKWYRKDPSPAPSINCPTDQFSKQLASILSPLKSNEYTVTNIYSVLIKISVWTIEPQEIMVSFDIVSLFTPIPTTLVLQVTKNRLEADPTITVNLLEFVLLNNNYFVVDGTLYRQIFGCLMSSPVSTILANLVMEYVEERAFEYCTPPS